MIKNNFSTTKIFNQNSNIVHIKSPIIEHLKTSQILFKTIRQDEEISKVSGGNKNFTILFQGETKFFLDGKNAKIKSLSHAYNVYAKTFNVVEILIVFHAKVKI